MNVEDPDFQRPHKNFGQNSYPYQRQRPQYRAANNQNNEQYCAKAKRYIKKNFDNLKDNFNMF